MTNKYHLGGYLDASAGWRSNAGAFARAELGVKPIRNFAAFGFVDWQSRIGKTVGVGTRWEF